MIHLVFAVSVLVILGVLITVGVIAGKLFGQWQVRHHAESKREVVAVAEGTVFAILGLLIAFTFSGAYDRFESRKMHIIDEANAYDTAYLRVNMLAPQTQPAVQQLIREYLKSRLAIYKRIPHIYAIEKELKESDDIKQQLWRQALAACAITNISVTTELFLPALNSMFDEANMGYYMAHVHSPTFVFLLLISLAVLGAILTGYSIAESKINHSIHIISYIAISTLTIFLIINLEFPRIGIIRIDSFDKVLKDIDTQWSIKNNI